MKENSLKELAAIIRADWTNVNYTAAPYLDAMETLDGINDKYYQDSGKSVVLYFLANAGSWRGETAKTVKVLLKKMAA